MSVMIRGWRLIGIHGMVASDERDEGGREGEKRAGYPQGEITISENGGVVLL